MKREYVIPDFLAAVTADALLAGHPTLRGRACRAVARARAVLAAVAQAMADARCAPRHEGAFDACPAQL